MAEKNEVAKQPKQQKHGAVVPLSFYANKFTNLVQSDFSEHGIELDDYSKQCVMSSMSAIYNLVTSNKEAMENLNPSNLRQVVGQVASLNSMLMLSQGSVTSSYVASREQMENGTKK